MRSEMQLNFYFPDVKPHAFVGQSSRKLTKPNDEGRSTAAQRGLKQSEQIGVLKLFNEGVVNSFQNPVL